MSLPCTPVTLFSFAFTAENWSSSNLAGPTLKFLYNLQCLLIFFLIYSRQSDPNKADSKAIYKVRAAAPYALDTVCFITEPSKQTQISAKTGKSFQAAANDYLCGMVKEKGNNIRDLSQEELVKFFESLGEKKFRANQVYEWLWQKHAHSFAYMTNLSKE